MSSMRLLGGLSRHSETYFSTSLLRQFSLDQCGKEQGPSDLPPAAGAEGPSDVCALTASDQHGLMRRGTE